MTYLELINHAISILKKHDLNEEVAFDLLFGLSKKINDKLDFATIRNHQIDDQNFLEDYKKGIDDFVYNKKPLVRILGYAYFNHLKLDVFPGVFAFRKETELIIDWANKITQDYPWINRVLDACCGTGALGLNYKVNNQSKKVDLLDINPIAIQNTLHNQIKNEIRDLSIIHDSIFDYVFKTEHKYDLLLCNPPYIKKGFVLEEQVTLYDPQNALYDFEHDEGITFYTFLIKNIKSYMNEKFFLIFEIGFDQYEVLKNFLDQNHFKNYLFIKDYNNLWRYLIISSEGLWKYIDSRN